MTKKILAAVITFSITFLLTISILRTISKKHIPLKTNYTHIGRFLKVEPGNLLERKPKCKVVLNTYTVFNMDFKTWYQTPKLSVVYFKTETNAWYERIYICNIKKCELVEENWYPDLKYINKI